jgi:hypothetical protein
MSNTTILAFEKELKDWSKSLSFYDDELKIFERRLEEVILTPQEVVQLKPEVLYI